MRVLIALVTVLTFVLVLRQVLLISSVSVAQIAPPGTYFVDHLIDSGTLAVNMDGHVESVRLLGVDTPQAPRPNVVGQCYGSEASAFVRDVTYKAPVRLIADAVSDNRDRLGRLVRYIYLSDGRFLNQTLVENGYGFADTQHPFSKSHDFTQHQETARLENRGLWASCQPQLDGNKWRSNDIDLV
jgi:micrococcal nuclease